VNWDEIAESYLAVADEIFNHQREQIDTVSATIARKISDGGKVLICGNGGSAGDAQHFAGELVNRFLMERKPYASIALTTDSSVLTAIGNDYSYGEIFSKQVEALGTEKDVLIAISTSGNSENILAAVRKARELGLLTVGMTGGQGGALVDAVEECLLVASSDSTPRIQEGHGLIIHAICQRIEEILK